MRPWGSLPSLLSREPWTLGLAGREHCGGDNRLLPHQQDGTIEAARQRLIQEPYHSPTRVLATTVTSARPRDAASLHALGGQQGLTRWTRGDRKLESPLASDGPASREPPAGARQVPDRCAKGSAPGSGPEPM
jgi:hypothetical protein